MKKLLWLGLLLLCATPLAFAGVGTGYYLFGNATYVLPGENSNRAVQLVSDANADPAVYSGIDFPLPSGLTVGTLSQLSTDYFFPLGFSCGQGSPRFAIQVNGGGYVFAYIGPPLSWVGCTAGSWQQTGNMLTSDSIVDDGQFGNTGLYESWAAAQLRIGADQPITDIFIVSDAGPAGSQTVEIDNTMINSTLYTYDYTKADCRNGGYAALGFKNQGQCVAQSSVQ